MGAEAKQLPRIDFSGVVPSKPGTGTWPEVRAQVMHALATSGCFDAHYPALTPELRAELFDGAVRPLFALPADVKRRNAYGPDKPFHGYLGGIAGFDGYESLAIVEGTETGPVRDFAGLMWPDGGDHTGFCDTVHGAARRIFELEEAVRRMVMEGLGVAKYHDALSKSTWHLLRMSEYKAPNAAEKTVRYMTHQDTNLLSVVCQHQVEGLEMQTRDGEGSSSSRRRRRWLSWSATRSGHGQMTGYTHHFTGLLSPATSPDTPRCCSRSLTTRSRCHMNWWATNTLFGSGPMTTTTSSASAFLKKVVARKINSRPTVECKQTSRPMSFRHLSSVVWLYQKTEINLVAVGKNV